MKTKHHGQMSESFLTAVFLSLSGGLQDAYTYLFRGKVFANAQTGNIVLLSTNIMDGRWDKVLHYLVPLCAFALGVLAAEKMREHFQAMQRLHWRQLVVLGEVLLLFAVGFLPQSQNLLANAIVSFSCAMQVQAFRKVNGYAFASTMCIGDQLAVLFLELHGPGAQTLLQDGLVLQQDLHGTFGLLVPAHDSLLLGLGKAVLDGFEVLELQLGIDDTLVAHRVDRTIDMGNVIVLETTEHMNNGVRVADVGQKLVAQPLAFRGTFHQSGDIDDLDSGGNHPLGIVDLREPNEPLVGNGDDAHVGLDRTERKIRRLRLGVGQAVEKGRFTHVGQPHDTAL